MIDFLTSKHLAVAACLSAGILAGGGIVFLAAPSDKPDQHLEVRWADPIEVASGDAYRGPWRMNESNWRFVDDPTVALTEEGSVGVAWTDHVEQDLFFQRYDSEGEEQLDAPVNLSNSPDVFSWLPRMVIPEGNPSTVYILWQEIVFSGGTHGGEIFFVRSTDGGRTFTEPINLSNTQAGAGKGRLTKRVWHNGSLDLAGGPDGQIYAAWTEYEGALRVSRSTDGGNHFSEPLTVAGSESVPARGPTLAVDTAGTIHLAWSVGEDPEADIHYASSDDQGRSFGEPTIVAESSGHSDAPALAADHTGALHLAYGERPKNAPERSRIQYTRAEGQALSFEPPRTISGGNEERGANAHFPSIRTGGAGRVVVLWERYPEGSDRPQGLGVVVSEDGGTGFTSPAVVSGSADPALGFNGSQQGLLMQKLAVNRAGALAVVNSTFRRGEASHIWLHRGQLRGR